jgi:FMN hydrolase / 5-amino-6-(5-phospho-D-ribitylamino)uracil phosphatase
MVRALLLDMMGVLVRDPYREALQAATGVDELTAQRFKDPTCWPLFEVAEIDEAEFVRRFFAPAPGAPALDVEAFHATRRRGYRLLPGMRELVGGLEGRVERYVASNYPVWVEELRSRFRFDDWFEGVYASHHLGVRKPDPAFFARLLERIGHEPGDCLFVDDREANCAAAARCGIPAHHFVDAVGLRRALAARGLVAST